MKKNKIIIFLSIIVVLLIILFFAIFKNNTAKKLKFGNNSTSQEIADYILSISSYESIIEVNVKSKKSENKYIIKQAYKGLEDNMQEIIEPSNISGVKIVRNGNNLKIENSNLNLATIFENYKCISESSLDLNSFIEEYKNDEYAVLEENDNEIIMKTSSKDKSKIYKTLYINRETRMPKKMEVQDDNKKIAIYILYNEVKVNS